MIRPHSRATRPLLAWILALALISVTVLLLTSYAHTRMNSPRRSKLAAIVEEARQRIKSGDDEARAARTRLPAGTILPAEWECYECIRRWRQDARLDDASRFANAFLQDPRSFDAEMLARYAEDGSTLPEALRAPDIMKMPPAQFRETIHHYFRSRHEEEELLEGCEHGLCANLAGKSPSAWIVAPLLAARAVCEALDGDSAKAIGTCITAYHFNAISDQYPYLWGTSDRTYSDSRIDRAMWNIADITGITPADQARFLDELDKRRPTQAFVDACRTHAACIELDLKEDLTPAPFSARSFLTRPFSSGCMEIADELLAQVDQPPCKTGMTPAARRQIRLGHWNRPTTFFRYIAIRQYAQHYRSALEADVARLAFALKAWKKEHGLYPATLGEMTPKPTEAGLLDPETGQPIDYETTPKGGFLITLSKDNPARNNDPLWEAQR